MEFWYFGFCRRTQNTKIPSPAELLDETLLIMCNALRAKKWYCGFFDWSSRNLKYQISTREAFTQIKQISTQEWCRKWKFGILGSAAEPKIPNFHFLQDSWLASARFHRRVLRKNEIWYFGFGGLGADAEPKIPNFHFRRNSLHYFA